MKKRRRRIDHREESAITFYLKEYWRPVMAWNYAVIVLFDFLLAPIMLGMYTFYTKHPYIPWQPLTIQGGGMFHIAMGAVLGISAWSRGTEKMQEAWIQRDTTQVGISPQQPNPFLQPSPYAPGGFTAPISPTPYVAPVQQMASQPITTQPTSSSPQQVPMQTINDTTITSVPQKPFPMARKF